jgi:hypothetical protein
MNDLIAEYADGYLKLISAVENLTEQEWNHKPDAKTWSVKQIVVHLSDAELVIAMRMKQVISEENPKLPAFNQDRWTERQHYADLDPDLHLEQFGLLRESMLPILGGLEPQDWQRTGEHSEAGTLTLQTILEKCVRHLDTHLAQIARVKSSFRG